MINAAYIHIPFCEHICHYCDFNKVFLKGQPVDEYLDALEKEIILTVEKYPTQKLKTIFIGGGTPTALNVQQLDKLFHIIQTHLPFDSDVEFSIEVNPGDLSKDKLKVLYEAGINRISFGVQTFNNELLKKIGRTHRKEDVFRSIDAAKNIGFHNISVDLMYNLPGQTLSDFKDSLNTSFSLDINHFSGYSLIIEPKTVFYQLMNKGQLHVQDEDTEAEMYDLLMNQMEKHGYFQYEISNFAQKGYESIHNLTYWNNEYYYGFGAGAHSYINKMRRSNYGPLKKYIDPLKKDLLPIMDEQTLSEKEMCEEEMFLGLRKTSGVSVNRFIEKFGKHPQIVFPNKIESLINKQLLKLVDDHIVLTRQGRFLGNEVFEQFLLN